MSPEAELATISALLEEHGFTPRVDVNGASVLEQVQQLLLARNVPGKVPHDVLLAIVGAGFDPSTPPEAAIAHLDDLLTASATFGHATVARLVAMLRERGCEEKDFPEDLRERLKHLEAIRDGNFDSVQQFYRRAGAAFICSAWDEATRAADEELARRLEGIDRDDE
jgi:hypothetical protein